MNAKGLLESMIGVAKLGNTSFFFFFYIMFSEWNFIQTYFEIKYLAFMKELEFIALIVLYNQVSSILRRQLSLFSPV